MVPKRKGVAMIWNFNGFSIIAQIERANMIKDQDISSKSYGNLIKQTPMFYVLSFMVIRILPKPWNCHEKKGFEILMDTDRKSRARCARTVFL